MPTIEGTKALIAPLPTSRPLGTKRAEIASLACLGPPAAAFFHSVYLLTGLLGPGTIAGLSLASAMSSPDRSSTTPLGRDGAQGRRREPRSKAAAARGSRPSAPARRKRAASPRTPYGLRPDPARLQRHANCSREMTRGAVAPRRGEAGRCSPLKGSRRPTSSGLKDESSNKDVASSLRSAAKKNSVRCCYL